ncbi:RNase3 domain-containing protein [Xylariaceae sp. FL0016]|nr:RNase3 domain-containing protein [Xylariaceae sp. FL0016]
MDLQDMDLLTDSSSDESVQVLENVSIPPRGDELVNPAVEVEVSTANKTNDTNDDEDRVVIHARAYQLEMLEESLRRNTIVCMDTGSGKTQVAVLRIQAELERSLEKIVWFLAPTVALCEQQFRVLESQVSGVQMKLLLGSDNMDTWSEQRIWDDCLRNVQVVVSSYQVLYDAISHGFLHFGWLSLIVFDEAHNCTGKHPGSMIMERYHLNKAAGSAVPHILGLTASPIMRSNPNAIEKIERTLDAVCRSPRIHREQLIATVKHPTVTCASYVPARECSPTNSLKSLEEVYLSLNIYEDPTVLWLGVQNTERSRDKLMKVLEKGDTFVRKQMRSLCRKGSEIQHELGVWAANYFVYESIRRFLHSTLNNDNWFETWETEEKTYLSRALERVNTGPPRSFRDYTSEVSDKFTTLLHLLSSAVDNTTGIVFVKETITVSILAQMLTEHPLTKTRFKIGTMTGTSSYAKRKRDVGELDSGRGAADLEKFRLGELNLLVATSVLEEGIDVPACNLVVCFDKLSNLKSFIQRRGRARMRDSRLVLFLDELQCQNTEWTALEEEMKKRYEDDMRQIQELVSLEEFEQDTDFAPLHVPDTGARLDLHQAKSHLEHFCRVIASTQYVDSRPYYLTRKTGDHENGLPMLHATVLLPVSLPPHLRRIDGAREWFSEKNACKDAAFQAYKELYKSGMINDNLVPLIDEIMDGVDHRASTKEVDELWSPWPRVAHSWQDVQVFYQRRFRLKDQGNALCEVDATLPCPFPMIPEFELFWDKDKVWAVETERLLRFPGHDELKRDHSSALLDLAYGHRWKVEDKASVMHLRSNDTLEYRQHIGQISFDYRKPPVTFNSLLRINAGQHPAEADPRDCFSLPRNPMPFFFEAWLSSRPPLESVRQFPPASEDERSDVGWVALKPWPKRSDFLHPVREVSAGVKTAKQYHTICSASQCSADGVSWYEAHFGAFLPSILHIVEIYLIAEELCKTVLRNVKISDLSLVVTALSSRAAAESTNYERLEFLGDSLLKLCTTVAVSVRYPHFPEGYLSAKKDQIVSNSTLSRLSAEAGLDRFIMTKAFTGRKWRPLYVEDLMQVDPDLLTKREMSTKTLADVVESLIGAAYVDGGIPRALSCIRELIPETQSKIKWYYLDDARALLYEQRALSTTLTSTTTSVEKLIGYTFENKSLLIEATTHSSYNLSLSQDACMERLEFLGDAILDNIIVRELWSYNTELTNAQMHLLRTASANADFLGFCMMEWTFLQEKNEISKDADHTAISTMTPIPFWKFMRHGSHEVGAAQQGAEARHAAERDSIIRAINNSPEYPWTQLAHLKIPKFFSDMFESVLGAVWVDSGSMEVCSGIVGRAGILPYLSRMLAEGVDALHPKNKLGILAGRDKKTVRYEHGVRGDVGAKELFCRVYVDEELVVEVGDGVSPEEVVTKAADRAWRLLSM